MMRKFTAVVLLILALFLTSGHTSSAQEKKQTLEDVVQLLKDELDIRFVYDSSIDLAIRYGKTLPDLKQAKAKGTKEVEKVVGRIFAGTGFTYEVHKKYVVLRKKDIKPKDYTVIDDTTEYDILPESRITALRNRNLNFTQTGFKKIDGQELKKGVAFLSQPDVIKSLQTLPGVASGTELLSGFYVHGGDGRDNLFLIDGVEIYSTSHLAGLFSAFNVETIDHLDFYKSGFPARYGGKLSSVVEVTNKEGDLYEHHGSFSIGLLNGSLQVDGPLVKGKTSYNIGLRRSWLEPFTVPVFALLNRNNRDHKKMGFRYAMTDLNASVTHHFNPDHKLSFNFYAGQDFGRYTHIVPTVEFWNAEPFYGENENAYGMKWGNLLGSLNWTWDVNEKFAVNAIGYYTQSMTKILMDKKTWTFNKVNVPYPVITKNFQNEDSNSRIQDAGFKANFFYDPDRGNHIRFGADLKMHFYQAGQDINYHQERNEGNQNQAENGKTTFFEDHSQSHYQGGELAFYAEDEIGYLDWLTANIGARYVLFLVPGKTYHRVEPRLALKVDFCPEVAFKLSYTEMNQFTHKMSTHTLDLPTFSFLPSNDQISPMHSRQVAGGFYFRLPYHITFNLEGYYKTLDHLMEYKGTNSYAPSVTNWQLDFSEGQGQAYGMETELSWKGKNTDLSAYYTLSWNERYFKNLYSKWFPDSHDNRHKFTLLFSHRFNKHFDLNLSWHYHTGDRITESSQFTMEENPHYGQDNELYPQPPEIVHRFYNTTPNNFKLPDYHRLDLGFNWRKTTKRGHESIWNLSIYNAYCHVNAIFAEVQRDDNGNATAYQYGLIPIIPMFSWTLKF